MEVYGGGIGDTDFLQQWSTLTGDHDVADYSTSTSSTGTSRTRTWRTEPILSIADLAALPKTRALVRLPGHKPVLVRKIWWHDTEFRDVVEQSLAQFADADDGDDQPHITVAAPQEPQ
ncbi:TraM recognition domain-containing protein [Nocardia farcinica]|uniref:TraM recognition domain-containing protein n=1 Tax=Nocardia farcinica TaxID=37329 RepID=UPI003CC7F7CF